MEREADKLRSTQNLIFGIINVCLFHFWPGGLLMTSSNEKHLFVRKKSFTSWMATEIFPFQSEIVPPKSIQLRKQSMEIPHFLWKSTHGAVATVECNELHGGQLLVHRATVYEAALVWDIYANFSLKSKSCIGCWMLNRDMLRGGGWMGEIVEYGLYLN